MSAPFPMIGVAVGNSRTRVGILRPDVEDAESFPNTDLTPILSAVQTRLTDSAAAGVLVASVNDPVADKLSDSLSGKGARVERLGRDLPVPIPRALDDDSTVGQDRLLCALGAAARAGQACVVIDCGTAITVDFVDGEGTFQGGVIAPGLGMMLRALHEQTSALPKLTPTPPDPQRGPFGKDTAHAMQLGARYTAIGLVRYAIERYAEVYQAYPQIVATGGDAELLFTGDEVVESVVPDLQLVGMAEAWKRIHAPDADEE